MNPIYNIAQDYNTFVAGQELKNLSLFSQVPQLYALPCQLVDTYTYLSPFLTFDFFWCFRLGKVR